jgi:RsiW-degrading membrane proteinase PrsW (M82 family)
MGLLVSILAGIIPMFIFAWFLYLLDRYEKEPLLLLVGVFAWGAVIAAGAAYLINTLSSIGLYWITQSDFATQLTLSTLIAPAVEETLKGAAVFIVYLVFRSEFDSPLDGVIYGGITALGFAATENIWYIHQFGFLESGWGGILDLILIRVFLVGWQHPFYTAFIGLGFAVARRSKQTIWRWIAPLIGWSTAVTFHLLHNLFAGLLVSKSGVIFSTIWDWSGYLGLLILMILLIKREQVWMKEYLAVEHDQKMLSAGHYQTACSAWRQSITFLKARFQGNYREIRRFYQTCGDLMHKKRQLAKHGDELGTSNEIQRLRAELKLLGEELI